MSAEVIPNLIKSKFFFIVPHLPKTPKEENKVYPCLYDFISPIFFIDYLHLYPNFSNTSII